MTFSLSQPVAPVDSEGRRIEHDMLGSLAIPAAAYWGIHTARAVANFPISGTPIGSWRLMVRALAVVKEAAARANVTLGCLDPVLGNAIAAACHDVAENRFDAEFPVDVIQGGAGTSTNMNANEVIANRALELLGRPRGDYATIHPNEHVNLGQSTNDVYPTAVRLAIHWMLTELVEHQQALADCLARKANEFAAVRKLGRTQLQDAVPMTLGDEFAAFAEMVQEDVRHLTDVATFLLEINLGGTAIGTGINTHRDFPERVREELAQVTGLKLVTAGDLVRATQDCGDFVLVSSALKRSAVKVSKICNDLRLLASGPRAGLAEIRLPERQAGSSIMPGKVNPVIPETVNQIAFQVIGHDVTVTMAAEAGQLQLNAFEPIMVQTIFSSIRHLGAGYRTLADLCVAGIVADEDVAAGHLDRSLAHATVLSPLIGYAAAARVAREALATGRPVGDIVLGLGLMTDQELRSITMADPAEPR